ncbi:MAG TPA: oxidoreductase [Solirubrobacteraceae bacterium]|nr:oxidoreductase [Solirubrobacteraceae bacterium]
MSSSWTAADMPPLRGQVAVVTGANSGIGLIAARELARAGASLVMAVRNVDKGREAVRTTASDLEVDVRQLDLADLASVRSFAAGFADSHERLDLLVNNAGVMAPPRRLTADGFESQIGTNHLGHFALTGLLLESLRAADSPRVVTVSSDAHRFGRIRFDNLQGERHYNTWLAYSQSKLANLLFAFELQRRAVAAGWNLLSVAAHPGYAATNLQSAGPAGRVERMTMVVTNRLVAQSAEMGALPTLYAAVADLPGGSFVGPNGFMGLRGHPHLVTASARAYDEDDARRLWSVSEELTGIHYEFGTTMVG